MDVNAATPGVELHEILLELTDSANGTLQNLFDEHSFLWMDHLIIALFKFFKYFNILDVETSQMMKDIINRPSGDILDTVLIEL
jgi:hypothetical protein